MIIEPIANPSAREERRQERIQDATFVFLTPYPDSTLGAVLGGLDLGSDFTIHSFAAKLFAFLKEPSVGNPLHKILPTGGWRLAAPAGPVTSDR
jgi:hypothetical protein